MLRHLFGGKKKQNNSLPRAIAFVDYEHWFISTEKLYHKKPDIQAWFNDLKTKCTITEVTFFGDFSKFREKEIEIKRIRRFTNKIIDTYNPDLYYKKDYTDFIILDNIYQKALSQPDCDMFIIFSGDGHFSSVAAFLRTFCNKEVGIYGVKNCISKNLISSSSWVTEVPLQEEITKSYRTLIIDKVREGEDNKRYMTFGKTSEIVSTENNIDPELINSLMSDLIKDGYLEQSVVHVNHKTIRVINTNWKKIEADGLID